MKVVVLDEEQAKLVFPLFRQVFGADIAPALVEWKYGAGHGVQYGVLTEDGRLVAHCGLMYRHALVEGRPARVAHFGDNMGVPEKPGGLARRGSAFGIVFDHMLKKLPDQLNPDALTYGFPSSVAARLLERLALASRLDTLHELSFAATPARPRRLLDLQVQRVEYLTPALRRRVDGLWQEMAQDFSGDVIGARDAGYVEHRYVRHPQVQYEMYRVVTAWRRTLALLVCKRTGDELEVMDIIGSLKNIGRCLEVLPCSLPALHASFAKIWLLSRHAAHFGHLATNSVELEFPLMVNYNSSGGQLDRFRNRWWLTSGDTDYR